MINIVRYGPNVFLPSKIGAASSGLTASLLVERHCCNRKRPTR
jgi:hypothetical protein